MPIASDHEWPINGLLSDPLRIPIEQRVSAYLVDYFAPVSEEVFNAYREIMPIDPGFSERCELWRIPGYLAHVIVGGSSHLGNLVAAVQQYL